MRKKLLIPSVVLSLAALPMLAQNNATRGGLGGAVTDASGAVIPDAKVVLDGPQGSVTSKTDSTGSFNVTGLTPGFYTITVTAPGFETYVSTKNEVVIDHSSNINVKLSVGRSDTTVTVEGGAVQIDTTNTSINTSVTDTFYNAVPLQRNVSSAFYVAPGVVLGTSGSAGTTNAGPGTSNPSIGGASGLENLYIADGVTITDQAFGGLGVYNVNYGSLGSGINLAFIKEVDVKTGAFEPKYGRGDGGIVEILTKSGSNTLHGAISAYMTPGSFYAARYQPYQFGYVAAAPFSTLSSPLFEASAEIGGFILKDKLFYYGAFDPSFRQNLVVADPTVGLNSVGQINVNTTASSYAGKLTYAATANTLIEFSSYGDPSRKNNGPEIFSASSPANVSSAYQYGTRNTTLRANTVISPTWTASAAYYYNYSVFREQPQTTDYNISDRSVTNAAFVNTGLGAYSPTKNDDYSIQAETEKTVRFFGEHTFQIGYLYDHTNFENSSLRSGLNYAIPSANILGQSLLSLYPSIPAGAIGASTNSTFRLFSAGPAVATATSPASTCLDCPVYKGNRVYLQVYRGTYAGTSVLAKARYQVGYGNDTYKINRYVTADLGVRWEQQHYEGTVLNYLFNDNWSPRLGVNIDPFGDHKTKFFFNYARYQNVLPLDAAIRQLGNEQDDTSFYYAPASSGVGGAATINPGTNAVIPVLDSAHVLNGTGGKTTSIDPSTGAIVTTSFGKPSFASSTGEGILPGTRMEYENEYIIGVERQLSRSSVVKARYTDRRLGRIVEDNGSQSPEGSTVDANYAGGIANITKNSDYFLNEQEVTYTNAQFVAANPGQTPGSSTLTAANYKAPVPGCTYGNDVDVANGGYFQHFNGTNYPGACITNAATAGTLGADGVPDGFAQPIRHYQAFDLEYNTNLTKHLQTKINYRFAKLFGNYEGFYRNDNGQSDPGISSLFDFTAGQLGLLGDQFTPGYLNTDRRNVGNAVFAYTIGGDTPFFGGLRGLTVGSFIHAASGAPLSAYQSHPIYLTPGEVPVGGRGNAGRLPTTIQLDLHADAPVHLGEKYTLKFAFDAFNATNSQFVTNRNQNLDTSPGASNPDYNRPSNWQGPFYGRASVVFQF